MTTTTVLEVLNDQIDRMARGRARKKNVSYIVAIHELRHERPRLFKARERSHVRREHAEKQAERFAANKDRWTLHEMIECRADDKCISYLAAFDEIRQEYAGMF